MTKRKPRKRAVTRQALDDMRDFERQPAGATRFDIDLENDYRGYTIDMSDDQVRVEFKSQFGVVPDRVFRTGAAVYAGPVPAGGGE